MPLLDTTIDEKITTFFQGKNKKALINLHVVQVAGGKQNVIVKCIISFSSDNKFQPAKTIIQH